MSKGVFELSIIFGQYPVIMVNGINICTEIGVYLRSKIWHKETGFQSIWHYLTQAVFVCTGD